MSYEPYLISAFTTGLDTVVQPWILPQDAFTEIKNAYIHHGVIIKRQGMRFFGVMVYNAHPIVVSITNANPGNVALFTAAGVSNGDKFVIYKADGMTEIEGVVYQVANKSGDFFDIYDLDGNPVDTTNFGSYTGAGGQFNLILGNPIMGIKTFIDTDNANQLLIFDTKRAAKYNSFTNQFDPLDGVDIFDGTPSSFINAAAFGRTQSFAISTLYFTNFNGDLTLPISPMRSFTTGNTTSEFLPDSRPDTGHNYIIAAQFMFSFRQRLLLLNTVESDTAPAGAPPTGTGTNFAQRMRWSRANNPADSGNNWNEIIPGNGGFVDAPTSEQIVAATLLNDSLIVKFTNSVWTIEPTADPALPFRWVRINSFRACEAPYAEIEYDRYVASFGKRGIVACDRNEVVRIDDRIHDFMTEEVNTEFIDRMYSARNFTLLHSWTLYPSSSFALDPDQETEDTTSNFALIRTDEENAWSKYTVYTVDIDPVNGTNMSSLGYGEISSDLAFEDLPDIDAYSFTGSGVGDKTWGTGFFEGGNEQFLGGDQEGRVLYLEDGTDDMGAAIDFELKGASWNPFKDRGIQCQMGYVDFYVDSDEATFFNVEFFCDDIDTPYSKQTLTCLPNLGFIGEIVGLLFLNPVNVIVTNHGLETGDKIYIYNITSPLELAGGPFTVNVVDENTFTLSGINGTNLDAYSGGAQVVQRAYSNAKTWVRGYAGGKGYEHFIRVTNSDTRGNLRINAFMPWFRPSGNRMIGGG